MTLTADRARELFHYDDELGHLVRRKSVHYLAKEGQVPGTAVRGYRVVCVDGARFLEHRLIWLVVHGEWPEGDIDHIDGDPGNNRIGNLRDVDKHTNLQNMRRAPKSKRYSSLLGANWDRFTNSWKACIRVDGKHKHLGRFATAEEAHEAYIAAKRKYHKGCTI